MAAEFGLMLSSVLTSAMSGLLQILTAWSEFHSYVCYQINLNAITQQQNLWTFNVFMVMVVHNIKIVL